MKTEQTECSETSAYKIQTPGNYPEKNIQRNSLSNTGYQIENIIQKVIIKQEVLMLTSIIILNTLCHLFF